MNFERNETFIAKTPYCKNKVVIAPCPLKYSTNFLTKKTGIDYAKHQNNSL